MADIKSLAGGPPVDVLYMSSVDGVSIQGNGTPAHPLAATGLPGVGVVILQEIDAGTGDQQLVMEAGKSILRVTGDDEFLRINGITPPADLPDGSVITFQNFGASLITLGNNDAAGTVGTRILFRAADGNGYGINGDGGFVGGGSVQLIYVSGSGWNILVPSGAP